MLKVMIANHSAVIRESLAEMVCGVQGVELVGQAANAPEAIEMSRRLKPDVVIFDIRMPGGNGIQALQTIKTDEPSPVVIVLTSFSYPQYRSKCLKAGADYFLDKATEFHFVPEVLKQLQAGNATVQPTQEGDAAD